LTELQATIMRALWAVGEGSVADIQVELRTKGETLAPTTVATLLQRLSRQGWVTYRRNGRQFVYRAKVNQKEAAKGVLQRVVRSFFNGKVAAVTAQLLESEQLTSKDLEEMRRLIAEKGG
jgi:predicted transcriptional regulator